MPDQKDNGQNIVDLPTRVQERFKWQSRLKDQRTVSVLSLGSVVMVCLLINQYLNLQHTEGFSGKNREVASVGSLIDTEKNVQWEQRVARELNGRDVRMVQAAKPVDHDQLVFGELRGQYMAHLDADFKIRKLVLTGTGEVDISSPEEFLLAKKDLWSIQFDRVEMNTDDGSSTQLNLFKGTEKVGVADIEKNPFGKVKSLEIR